MGMTPKRGHFSYGSNRTLGNPSVQGGVPPSGGCPVPDHPPSGVPQASGREAPYTSWTRYHGSMRGSTKGSTRRYGTENTMGDRSMQRVSMDEHGTSNGKTDLLSHDSYARAHA